MNNRRYNDRNTIPAPGVAPHKLEKGRMIGVKVVVPPAPRPVIPPIVDGELMKAVSEKVKSLKNTLGYYRDPEKNTTGVSYKALITGITDAKKLNGIKNSKGKELLVFILETEYGKYVLSKKPLSELRDLHARFLDLDCETNRKMKVPIHEIKNSKEYFYFEKMEEKLELDVEVEYTDPDILPELNKTLLRNMNLPEIEGLIKSAERKRNTLVNMEIENIKVEEDNLFNHIYLAVKMETGEEYCIYIKEDKTLKTVFNVPENIELIEVETEERVYKIMMFFDNKPIDISEMKYPGGN